MNPEVFSPNTRREQRNNNTYLLGLQNAKRLELLTILGEQIRANGPENPLSHVFSSTESLAVFIQGQNWRKKLDNSSDDTITGLLSDLGRWARYLNGANGLSGDIEIGAISFKTIHNISNGRAASITCWPTKLGQNPQRKDRCYIPILLDETAMTAELILQEKDFKDIHPAVITDVIKDLRFLRRYYGFPFTPERQEKLAEKEKELRNINIKNFLNLGETLMEEFFINEMNVSVHLNRGKMDTLLRNTGFKDFYMLLSDRGKGQTRRFSLETIFSFLKLLVGIEAYREEITTDSNRDDFPNKLARLLSYYFTDENGSVDMEERQRIKDFGKSTGKRLKKMIDGLPANYFYAEEWMGNPAFYQGDSLIAGEGRKKKEKEKEFAEYPFTLLGRNIYLARAQNGCLELTTKIS